MSATDTALPASATARTRPRGTLLPRLGTFSLFALPGIALYLAFVLVPVVMSFVSSLTDENAMHPVTHFVGLSNYRQLLSDPSFHRSLGNTALLTAAVVVVPNAVGLGVALLLDRGSRLYRMLRTVFFTPVVLSSVVVSVIWQALLTDDGIINKVLRSLGAEHPPGWLSDPSLALGTVTFIMCWQMLGFCVVVHLAGLQGVPAELMEAAELDGAGPVRRFRHITWPMLAPSVTINTVMLLITAFKTYDQVQVLTNGGPGDGTTATVAFTVITTAFTDNRTGYSAAMSLTMLVLIAVVSVVVLRVLQRREVTL